MAKVGFWLHGARGKLAGSSLRKGADGSTVITQIVTPYNPRTYAQIYQRAIMATVMRAYSAGKSVFDHSFQGRQVGAQNMERFMSLNARILRNLCVQEQNEMPYIHSGGATIMPHCRARLVAYSTSGPVGFDGMQISRGSYQQTFFEVKEAFEVPFGDSAPLEFRVPVSNEGETCAEYAKRCGLIADDLYTICGFYPTDNWFRDGYDDGVSFCGLQRVYSFFAIRMHVKGSFVSSSAAVAHATLGDMFTFEQPIGQGVINDNLMRLVSGDWFSMADLYTNGLVTDSTQAWCNIIRSRVNEDLRSTTVLKQNIAWANDGIIPAYVLPAWYPYITGNPYPNPPVPSQEEPPTPDPLAYWRLYEGIKYMVDARGMLIKYSDNGDKMFYRYADSENWRTVLVTYLPQDFPWGWQYYPSTVDNGVVTFEWPLEGLVVEEGSPNPVLTEYPE